MNILHIAHIDSDRANGVSEAVPLHLYSQSKLSQIGLLNLNSYVPRNSHNRYKVYVQKELIDLPSPFNAPDVVVFHEIYRPAFLRLSSQLRKRHIPYVVMPHCSLTKEAQSNKRLKKTIGNLLGYKRFINGASAIQYLSDHEQSESSKWKVESFISGNGITLPKQKKQHFTSDGAKLIYVGRLDIRAKGLDRLVEAVAISQNDMREKNIRIDIYGPDQENNLNKLQELVKSNGISDLISIKGPIFGGKKVRAILDHDYFIQLSRYEGSPLGVLEAISLGMPVIVTDGTTLANAARQNEFGYRVNTIEEISTAILKCNDNITLSLKMSNYSRVYAKTNLDWKGIAKSAISQYELICMGKFHE